MKNTGFTWKRGRGKLGPLAPLLGNWEAQAETPMGLVQCSRNFSPILGNTYVQLIALWKFKEGVYEEHAVFGLDDNKTLSFWSFTSDGKHSFGTLADVSDIHPQAVGFQALMPAGLARMIYWPNDLGGMTWAVESKTKKGWNRFTEHHYQRV
jgi:hypothetical protein